MTGNTPPASARADSGGRLETCAHSEREAGGRVRERRAQTGQRLRGKPPRHHQGCQAGQTAATALPLTSLWSFHYKNKPPVQSAGRCHVFLKGLPAALINYGVTGVLLG